VTCRWWSGGIVPDADAQRLRELGVAAVFTPKDFSLTAVLATVVGVVRDAHGLAPLPPTVSTAG
jgi:(2R)-ethylmalonyl-CoA mutase